MKYCPEAITEIKQEVSELRDACFRCNPLMSGQNRNEVIGILILKIAERVWNFLVFTNNLYLQAIPEIQGSEVWIPKL